MHAEGRGQTASVKGGEHDELGRRYLYLDV